MKRFYEEVIVEDCLRQIKYETALRSLRDHLFVIQYQKGELVTSPFQKEILFQIVVHGSLKIYFIRDDGSIHALSRGQENYLLGEMELFTQHISNVYAEADEDLICLALSMEKSKDEILENASFLRLLCKSLAEKIQAITHMDAAPESLKQRVLIYMKYKCENQELKGLQQAAFHLNCSVRHLQRLLNQYEDEGIVKKTGKGAYKLICASSGRGMV